MLTGLPKTVIISSEEVRRALDEPVTVIIDAMKSTLDKTPPELAADIMDRGIVLAGGGALLQGLDERVRHETQMPVHLAESPLTCVAVGSGPLARGVRRHPPHEPKPRPPQRPAPVLRRRRGLQQSVASVLTARRRGENRLGTSLHSAVVPRGRSARSAALGVTVRRIPSTHSALEAPEPLRRRLA